MEEPSIYTRSAALSDGLELRPARAEDRFFLEWLFRSTREFLYSLPLPPQSLEMLLDQQYRLQQASYKEQWPDAATLVIQLSGKAIGKIMLDENQTALHIVDFAIKPDMRGRGYGTAIVQALQADAAKRGLSMQLSVDRQNLPAKKLYLGLGFQVNGISETHESMRWLPLTPGNISAKPNKTRASAVHH